MRDFYSRFVNSEIPFGELAKIALAFFSIYFGANYLNNAAFSFVSPGTVSILSATSGFFTLFIGWRVGVEKMSFLRVIATFVCVGGVIALGYYELVEDAGKDHAKMIKGTVFSLVSALFYAIYSVWLKKWVEDESKMNNTLFFGIIGTFSVVFLWPILIIFHYTGYETFENPPSDAIAQILINIFFGSFLANFLWIVAMELTTALAVAVGLTLVIPMTFLGELLVFHQPVPLLKGLSGLCVIVGFIIVNIAHFLPDFDAFIDSLVGIKRKDNLDGQDNNAKRKASLSSIIDKNQHIPLNSSGSSACSEEKDEKKVDV